MSKIFNVSGACVPEVHYMVNLDEKLAGIRQMIDAGKYFSINCARQYGKTTTLKALKRYLQHDYYVVLLDFQKLTSAKYRNENTFSLAFSKLFLREIESVGISLGSRPNRGIGELQGEVKDRREDLELLELFEHLSNICAGADKPVVLMIDEVDSAADNQVFLDFLAQLRAGYIERAERPAFWSVILAGVYDVKNLKQKIRPEEDRRLNSPWNIAADFRIDMSFSGEGIGRMLGEYESDHHTGMDVKEMACLLYDYTSGYPFLVSRLCLLLDEKADSSGEIRNTAWTRSGFHEAVREILTEKNPLFDSLMGKLIDYPRWNAMLRTLLFTGKSIVYNPDEPAIHMAAMFGFIKNHQGMTAVSNRIFETRLYNYYLSASEMQGLDIYKASLQDRSQFIVQGQLNMRRILEKFTEHFHELYGDRDDTFLEDEGRSYFLLYLRPIINGTGNYYIESRTRELRRTDVIVDYCGEQFVIEMKIWHGQEYNERGEQQLVSYLEDNHQNKGYMISFNFNKKKQPGIREIIVGDKLLIEAMV